MDELNSILSSTQQKLNRFKQTACGSLSNIFAKGSVDVPETGTDSPTTSATASRRNTTACGEAMMAADVVPVPITAERIAAAKLESQKKMSAQLDKLDSLINKAENAEISMQEQTKQMKKMTK